MEVDNRVTENELWCSARRIMTAWGSVVVKALRYYSEGPGIDHRSCHWEFFFFESSDKCMCPGSTQPLKTITRIFLGVKAASA